MPLYFPAPKWDGTTFIEGQAKFDWRRDGGDRVHAGCDLYAPLESDVVAVDAGIVVEISTKYAKHTKAISILHAGIGIIRYGEIVSVTEEFFKIGAKVEKGGLVIGKVGQVAKVSPMLHFEMFDGSGSGRLSNTVDKIEYKNAGVQPNANYERRADLMNPTAFLQRLLLEGVR